MKYKWGELISLEYGKPVKDKAKTDGQYPVYGTNGQIGTSDLSPLCNHASFILGRKGAYRGVHYSSIPFSVIDTAFYAENLHPELLNIEWAYYKFLTYDINSMDSGSAIPSTDRYEIYAIEVDLPDYKSQEKIVRLLRSFDEKIELNNRINENLEQQATMLFESWFINYEPWGGTQPIDWENAPLGSFVEIKRGGSPRPIQDYLSDSGFRWLKISDVTSLNSPFVLEIKEHIKEEGLKKTVLLKAGELVLSNSATPGIPKILDVDSCIHDGWLYFPRSELSKYYLYLFFKHIRKKLVALGNGSVFTNLKTDILKAYPVVKADMVTLKKFDSLVAPLFEAMLNVDRENLKLKSIRDVLLPKLMNGEMEIDR